MNKKAYLSQTIVIILAIIIICGAYYSNRNCKYDIEEHKVTDILQISAGGFGSSDKCILQTTDGKLNLEGRLCKLQIGDKFYKKFNVRNCFFLDNGYSPSEE